MPRINFDTIFCPPVNSSGDVYHIGTYLIICRILGKVVPKVFLFYDTNETHKHADRAKDFLSGLGFGNVTVEAIKSKSFWAKTRTTNSAEVVRRYSEQAVDQKTTTSLISYSILRHGDFITRSIYEHIHAIGMKKSATPAHKWAYDRAFEVTKKLDLTHNRFVIINLRASKKANRQQEFTEPQLSTIAKFLAPQGIRMVLFDVGGSIGKKFIAKHKSDEYGKNIVIDVFPDIHDLPNKYSKFPHIFLLQQLASLKSFLGVIGNTSGTLDIAAFMGIRSICIHRFTVVSPKDIIIPYQDLRILLQTNFMSVYDYGLGLEKMKTFLSMCLEFKAHMLCDLQTKIAAIKLEADNFRLEHGERSCFGLDVAQKVANPAFVAQYQQVCRNQKLSMALDRRIEMYGSHTRVYPILTPLVRNDNSKDDIEITNNTSSLRLTRQTSI